MVKPRPASTSMLASGLNATQAAIIGLMHEQTEMSGGDITNMACYWLTPYWSTTRSQVYRELPVLLERDLIKPGRPGARGHQPYSLTRKGRNLFRAWLSEDPAPDVMRNQIALRVMFAKYHTRSQLEALISKACDYHTKERRVARDLRDEAVIAKNHGDMMSLDLIVDYHTGVLRWLNGNKMKAFVASAGNSVNKSDE